MGVEVAVLHPPAIARLPVFWCDVLERTLLDVLSLDTVLMEAGDIASDGDYCLLL